MSKESARKEAQDQLAQEAAEADAVTTRDNLAAATAAREAAEERQVEDARRTEEARAAGDVSAEAAQKDVDEARKAEDEAKKADDEVTRRAAGKPGYAKGGYLGDRQDKRQY